MSDYDELKHYMNLPDQQVYQMIGVLTPKQWDAFCETLNRLYFDPKAGLDIRRALFIARSYPIEDKKI